MGKGVRFIGIFFRWLCMAAMLSTPTFATGKSLDASEAEQAPVSLATSIEILEDPSRTLTFSDVTRSDVAARFKVNPIPERGMNFGLTSSAYWLRLNLHSTSERPLDQLLVISNPRVTRVDFYRIAPGGAIQVVETGYERPFANRLYKHRSFVFPVPLTEPGAQQIYLRVESATTLDVGAKLWNRTLFQEADALELIGHSIYFGVAFAMMLFNLLLCASLRDSSYAYFVVFILGIALGQLGFTGLGTQYVWGDVPLLALITPAVGTVLAGMAMIPFMRALTGCDHLFPRLKNALIGLCALDLIAIVSFFFAYNVKLALVVTGANPVVVIGCAIACALRGQRSAKIFVGAFLLMFLGAMVSSLRGIGIIPTTVLTQNGIPIGSAVAMILLAFALADRFHAIRAEKERAQAEALRAERLVIDTLRESERVLEARVDERTAELSATVERLKQTQSDLVESEKLASLGSLVAGVSHELNTPIGVALTTASTLEDGAREFKRMMDEGGLKKSAMEDFVQRSIDMGELLVRSCHRAANLISSFKQVAVDQTSEHRRPFDLLELANDNVTALRPSLKTATWVIEVDVPAGIVCDSYPGPLGQVLTNIIQNAAVHAFEDRTSGVLRISASAHGDTAELIISDDGQGMTAETLARIFEPFYTTKLGKGGSGLGLAICRNIVTGMLGGQLIATSQPGAGSQFVVRIPTVAPHATKSSHAA